MHNRPNDSVPPADQAASDAFGTPDAAVRRALEESHRQFFGFLRRRMGSVEEAEDVLQAFMIRAIERSAQLKDVQSVRGWLSRVLATTIVDHQRRAVRRRQREAVMDPLDIQELSIEADFEIDEAICNCLYKLLPTLKHEYAEVLWRIDLLEEPRQRVATELGLSLNNLTVRLHRGRQALKKRLEEMCLTCPIHGFMDCNCDGAARSRQARERQQRS
ncbi:MAG: sigma-70 family RNA polymerase sigma factor [Hyphomonas sp.]|nr:sigma-70 family RNA polymerase sigma factor [Hyphomonas sp.]